MAEVKKHLCETKKCTGCYACAGRCPKGAIELKKDKNGAIRPFIDESKCVDCGLCDKVCPVLNECVLNHPMSVYAAYAKPDIRLESASGGVATVLASKVIADGGVVYGAANTQGIFVEHIRVASISDIGRIQGTKYVHSHIGEKLLKLLIRDIDEGRKVLFVGSPCQVAGVKNLVTNKDNLYCVDLVCHGVPSWDTLFKCMRRESGCKSFSDKSITFRDADGFNIKIRDNAGEIEYIGNLKNSYYYNGFMEGYIYRDNCYTCRYAQNDRIGDITLGDFWGLDVNKEFDGDTRNGINAVLVNTDKGKELLELIKPQLSYWERSLEEAASGNGQLRHPSKDSISHKVFSKLIKYISADKAVIVCNIKKSIILCLRKALNKCGLSSVIIKLFPKLRKWL